MDHPDAGGSWVVLQDYGTSTTVTWSTAGLTPGIYHLQVEVRDQSSSAYPDAGAPPAC